MPDGLEVTPEDELTFVLTAKDATPKTVLTLKHPAGGSHSEPIAFKVKTTQPRRYLVRPNQGLIMPGQSEKVQILLVEKDKISLWQSFERLGQSALDSSKDKFLVQSTRVAPEEGLKAGDYEKLSNYWTKVMSNTSAYGVFNTKLPVKLVAESTASSTTEATVAVPASTTKSMPKTVSTSSKDVNSMNNDQLKTELTNLRHKYDELVSFSVNLTAERDILNNTLEQTKRELNKYLHKSAASDNRSNNNSAPDEASAGKKSMTMLYVVGLIFWILGACMGHRGQTKVLSHVPGMSGLFPAVEVATPTPVVVETKSQPQEEQEL